VIGVVLFSVIFLASHATQAYSKEAQIGSAATKKDTASTKEKQNLPYTVKEVVKEPLRGKTNWWNHGIQICTKDHLSLTEVMFSSDVEIVHEGMNSFVIEGKCKYFGTVMKAKDGNTLKYRIVTNDEAFQKINEAKKGNLTGTNWDEIRRWMIIHMH
jgi:hypothetical protein